MTLIGYTGVIVDVEVDISNGFPGWDIVGLPDMSIKESKKRISVALRNCGINLLSKKYVINLSPADIKKEGSKMDLAIAIGVLKELRIIPDDYLDDFLIVGELSLDGKVKPIMGALAIYLEAKELGIKNVLLPYDNLSELIPIEEVNIYGVRSLLEVINKKVRLVKNPNNSIDVNSEQNDFVDFKDIIGQYDAKRGIEIAASGGHNVRMIGPAGAGKTLLAKAMNGILPDLTLNEKLDINKIYSISKEVANGTILNERPFRNPHYTITRMGLIGGGNNLKVGEITLAHRGILFLDELTEFKPKILELLRTPLEEGYIVLARGNYVVTYPSRFILVCAMNPCPCGFLGSVYKECTCSDSQIFNYSKKISGPLLDRIDVNINVQIVQKEDYLKEANESSKLVKQRVNHARQIQAARYKNEKIYCNSELNTSLIKKYCKLDFESKELLLNAINSKQLSTRTYFKIIKLARTIADMEGVELIQKKHIIEAIHYKNT